MSFKLALIIDQLEEKYMGKWNHNWKISDSENLNLLLWTCSENEFYFHKAHAGDEFGECVLLCVIEQWLNIQNLREISRSYRTDQIIPQTQN